MLRLLTTAPLPDLCPHATLLNPVAEDPASLHGAAGLLLPHDGGPVADVQDRPDRWALLQLASRALRMQLPVLGWGSGAALLGRAAGGRVGAARLDGEVIWTRLTLTVQLDGELCLEAPTLSTESQLNGLPVLWRLGPSWGFAGTELPPAVLARFLETLPAVSPQPASLLEAIGGPDVLAALLDDFYRRCRQDTLLGPVFARHVHDWPDHLRRVQGFWRMVLGDGPHWRGDLNAAHRDLGLSAAHLERWLALFAEAAHAQLSPRLADELHRRAVRMGARLGRPAAQRSGEPSSPAGRTLTP
ncbi:globin [Deinococcus sonorensis]|uniref:Globin n=2 Tax=Deinococcus sonorensis TaxID=309891 RepID=A0AAU7U889_9DEIO